MRGSKRFVRFAVIGILIFCICLGFYVWKSRVATPKLATSEGSILTEVQSLISSNTIYPTTNELLIEGALKGMANAIHDPYSTYYTKSEATMQKQHLAAERIGIGIELAETNGEFVVISPIKNGPAEEAGVLSYDEIIQVDGVAVKGRSMTEVLTLFQGAEGTNMQLVIYRPSAERHFTFTIKRQKMSNQTITSTVIEDDELKIGYIEISLFAEKTGDEWISAVEQMMKQKTGGLIIDLRDNPGGYLHAATQMLSTFQKTPKVFGYMENASGALDKLATMKLDGVEEMQSFLKNGPIVILQNRGSASASEVFTTALRGWNYATVIGKTSFGKGTVQETWTLSNGGELKLSTHKWITAKKEWVHGTGITPDIETEPNPLSLIQPKAYTGNFKEGDFADEVAYAQQVLTGLGYNIVREDGFYDDVTAEAVALFRANSDLTDGENMDLAFFQRILKEVREQRENNQKDPQLQMAISYLHHQIE